MQITIRTPSSTIITLSLDPTDTLSHLRQKLAAAIGDAADANKMSLYLNAKRLDSTLDNKTLQEAGLSDGSELTVSSSAPDNVTSNETNNTTATTTTTTTTAPSSTPTSPAPIKKKSSSKCALQNCNDKIVKIVGTCRYCHSNFCAKHRLPETHACDEMQSCRQAAQDKLAGKLLGEKCVASKV